MTLYIQFAFGKTGTTSIQDFFNRYREEFSGKGLLCPEQGLSGSGDHLLTRLGLERVTPEIDRLFVEVRRAIDRGHHQTTALSSENFCFMPPEYVKRIAEHLEGFLVKILFYLRSEVPLVESVFLGEAPMRSVRNNSVGYGSIEA